MAEFGSTFDKPINITRVDTDRMRESASPSALRLLWVISQIGYGELRVIVKNGEPVRVVEAVKEIKLDV